MDLESLIDMDMLEYKDMHNNMDSMGRHREEGKGKLGTD